MGTPDEDAGPVIPPWAQDWMRTRIAGRQGLGALLLHLLRSHEDADVTEEQLGGELVEQLRAIGRRVDSAHRADHGERAWTFDLMYEQDAELSWYLPERYATEQRLARLAREDALPMRASELFHLVTAYEELCWEHLAGWPEQPPPAPGTPHPPYGEPDA